MLKNAIWTGVWLVVAILSAQTRAASEQASLPARQQTLTPQQTLQRYCLTCHTQSLKQRGTVPIAFDELDLTQIARDAAVWERIDRKVRTGLMPPSGAPRPDRETQTAFVTWIEGEIDRAARVTPNPGRTEPFHRLNRNEYQNAVRDLLALDVNISALLPADDASYGFDNIAGVLKVSPTLMERYLTAAQKISRLAVGVAPAAPTVDYYRVADDLRQDDHLEGLPLGTRGGIAIAYTFPMDAEYEIRPRLARDLNENVPLYLDPQQLEVSLDGVRLQMFTVPGVSTPQPTAGGRGAGRGQITQVDPGLRVSAKEREERNHIDDHWDVRVPVKAGTHHLTIAFLKKTSALDETPRLPFIRPYPAGVNQAETRMGLNVRSVEVAGPFSPTGAGASASRQRVFVCTPRLASREADCAKSIVSTLARRAFRRPVTDADLAPLMTMYEEGRTKGSFDAGIELAVKRLLVSPEFLFRVERDPANVAAGTPYRISDIELASRLSFFLWSSIPDDALLDLAVKRKLSDPSVLAAQVTRLIADPRSERFVSNFAGQWLYLRNLPSASPVALSFPDFDESLRQSLRRETELFVGSIVREDRPARDLLSADYTFLDERLAKHYGIPGVKGSHFRRVSIGAESPRRGLLGQGSILTVTSQPDRTSPVVRGKWILENFLGTSPPSPPQNVPDLKASVEPGAVLSMRDRMKAHRASPSCAGCHAIMDPIGLSLETFDGVGRIRQLGESSGPIDTSGALPDGTAFDGVAGLRQALLARSDQFVTTIAEKLLTYALGRGVEYYDEPAVRAIVRQAAQHDDRFTSGLILGVVQSTPFHMRRSRP
jgi:uncharacterized protein DUF1592/uncharacterized protein DUF1588/uncharacterized protein DUF1587/uncharacterized protein DUF1585/uncharacterized protein DUF1595